MSNQKLTRKKILSDKYQVVKVIFQVLNQLVLKF